MPSPAITPLCLAGLCAVSLRTWPPTALWPRPADPGGARCSPSAHTTSSPVSPSARGKNKNTHTQHAETTRINTVNLKENSTWQQGAAVTDIPSLKTSISSVNVIKRRFTACPLALDCFFLIVAAVIKQTAGCVCRSQRTEEQLKESVSLAFYCSNFTHMWNKSTPNMAL